MRKTIQNADIIIIWLSLVPSELFQVILQNSWSSFAWKYWQKYLKICYRYNTPFILSSIPFLGPYYTSLGVNQSINFRNGWTDHDVGVQRGYRRPYTTRHIGCSRRVSCIIAKMAAVACRGVRAVLLKSPGTTITAPVSLLSTHPILPNMTP